MAAFIYFKYVSSQSVSPVVPVPSNVEMEQEGKERKSLVVPVPSNVEMEQEEKERKRKKA